MESNQACNTASQMQERVLAWAAIWTGNRGDGKFFAKIPWLHAHLLQCDFAAIPMKMCNLFLYPLNLGFTM